MQNAGFCQDAGALDAALDALAHLSSAPGPQASAAVSLPDQQRPWVGPSKLANALFKRLPSCLADAGRLLASAGLPATSSVVEAIINAPDPQTEAEADGCSDAFLLSLHLAMLHAFDGEQPFGGAAMLAASAPQLIHRLLPLVATADASVSDDEAGIAATCLLGRVAAWGDAHARAEMLNHASLVPALARILGSGPASAPPHRSPLRRASAVYALEALRDGTPGLSPPSPCGTALLSTEASRAALVLLFREAASGEVHPDDLDEVLMPLSRALSKATRHEGKGGDPYLALSARAVATAAAAALPPLAPVGFTKGADPVLDAAVAQASARIRAMARSFGVGNGGSDALILPHPEAPSGPHLRLPSFTESGVTASSDSPTAMGSCVSLSYFLKEGDAAEAPAAAQHHLRGLLRPTGKGHMASANAQLPRVPSAEGLAFEFFPAAASGRGDGGGSGSCGIRSAAGLTSPSPCDVGSECASASAPAPELPSWWSSRRRASLRKAASPPAAALSSPPAASASVRAPSPPPLLAGAGAGPGASRLTALSLAGLADELRNSGGYFSAPRRPPLVPPAESLPLVQLPMEPLATLAIAAEFDGRGACRNDAESSRNAMGYYQGRQAAGGGLAALRRGGPAAALELEGEAALASEPGGGSSSGGGGGGGPGGGSGRGTSPGGILRLALGTLRPPGSSGGGGGGRGGILRSEGSEGSPACQWGPSHCTGGANVGDLPRGVTVSWPRGDDDDVVAAGSSTELEDSQSEGREAVEEMTPRTAAMMMMAPGRASLEAMQLRRDRDSMSRSSVSSRGEGKADGPGGSSPGTRPGGSSGGAGSASMRPRGASLGIASPRSPQLGLSARAAAPGLGEGRRDPPADAMPSAAVGAARFFEQRGRG